MARTAKRRRRLWDTYWFPGFRPQPTVHGIFGDPKARVITLNRRSKKRAAGAAVMSRWAGTTGKFGGGVVFRGGTLGDFLDWGEGGGRVAAGGGGGWEEVGGFVAVTARSHGAIAGVVSGRAAVR